MNGESVVFWVTAIFAVSGAVGMVISRKAVHSALWVAFTMINIAILYFAMEAPFLGVVQIIVYTGAVMMLFLFVLMIVGVDSSDSLLETIKGQRLVAIALVLSLAAMVVGGITAAGVITARGLAAPNNFNGGNVQGLAELIFGRYLLAFEVTSALLITAAVGAMVLAHRERVKPRKTQAQLQRERILGDHPTPLPAPGVLATNNAVNVPALLPDGTPAQVSLPAPFQGTEQSDRPEVSK